MPARGKKAIIKSEIVSTNKSAAESNQRTTVQRTTKKRKRSLLEGEEEGATQVPRKRVRTAPRQPQFWTTFSTNFSEPVLDMFEKVNPNQKCSVGATCPNAGRRHVHCLDPGCRGDTSNPITTRSSVWSLVVNAKSNSVKDIWAHAEIHGGYCNIQITKDVDDIDQRMASIRDDFDRFQRDISREMGPRSKGFQADRNLYNHICAENSRLSGEAQHYMRDLSYHYQSIGQKLQTSVFVQQQKKGHADDAYKKCNNFTHMISATDKRIQELEQKIQSEKRQRFQLQRKHDLAKQAHLRAVEEMRDASRTVDCLMSTSTRIQTARSNVSGFVNRIASDPLQHRMQRRIQQLEQDHATWDATQVSRWVSAQRDGFDVYARGIVQTLKAIEKPVNGYLSAMNDVVLQACQIRDEGARKVIQSEITRVLGTSARQGSESYCVVCKERSYNVLVDPCGHQCLCARCVYGEARTSAESAHNEATFRYRMQHRCPVCLGPMMRLMRVFDA